MKIIEQSYEIISDTSNFLKDLELYGRTCYKSEDLITKSSSENFIRMLIKRGHESVLEHKTITVKFITNRAVTHEIVRHRIASYSQESSRYCNYSKNKFGNELTFIKPLFDYGDANFIIWKDTMEHIEKSYFDMILNGAKPDEARGVLPNDLKTEIVCTMNIRQWRNFLKIRVSHDAHPQIRSLAKNLLNGFKESILILFDDIES